MSTAARTNEDSREFAELSDALGYEFREPAWLRRALTHSSYWNEQGEPREPGAGAAAGDNEVLELLGDAVLGLVVTEVLMAQFPAWSVGQLSLARSRAVNARALRSAAVRLGLGQRLLLGRGQEKSGLREQRDVLADAYEAVVAAIYLDSGAQGLAAARAFVERTLLDDVLRVEPDSLIEPDDKWAILEWLRLKGRSLPEFRLAGESGPDHRKTFRVEVIVDGESLAAAEGSSKKEAEQAAARLALARLRETP